MSPSLGSVAASTASKGPYIVATHGAQYGGNLVSDGIRVGSTSLFQNLLPQDTADLQFVYRLAQGYAPPALPANDVTVRASVLDQATSARIPVFFGGKRSATLEPGGELVSDPVPGVFTSGMIQHMTYVQVAATGQTWPTAFCQESVLTGGLGTLLSYNNEADSAAGGADVTMSGTLPTDATADRKFFGPTAIIGRVLDSTPQGILIIGDSIDDGSADLPDNGNQEQVGFWKRALNNLFPYVSIAQPADAASNFVKPAWAYLRNYDLMKYANFVLVGYGTNDLSAARTLAQIKADLQRIADEALESGARGVYLRTISPRTTSTDSWATTANQTVLATETTRTQLNDWIRTAPSPFAGYFDVADKLETARNSGIWKAPGYTADGIHPSPAAHIAAAAAIDTTRFA